MGAVVFLFLLAFLFTKVSWVFRDNKEEARIDIAGYKNLKGVDIVLYGGSTELRYYSPVDAFRKAGLTSYNYATSSARCDIVKEFIEDSRMTNNPKLYVIDLRTITMLDDLDVVNSTIRNWSDSLNVFSPIRWKGITASLRGREMSIADNMSYYFDIARYHSYKPGDVLANPQNWAFMAPRSIHNTDKGFAPNTFSEPFDMPTPTEERAELTEQEKKALERTLEYCDRKKLNVLFIVAPFAVSEEEQKVFNTCGDIITQRGYDFLDCNHHYEEIGLDFETDLSDINHVNYVGAQKYTDYLTDYFVAHYELPDHRNDPAYASWTEDYQMMQDERSQWEAEISEDITSHLEAREKALKMPSLDTFKEWYRLIRNTNFTVVIRINGSIPYVRGTDASFDSFLKAYGIDETADHYIGIWFCTRSVVSSHEDLRGQCEIGIDNGRGTDTCIVSVGDLPQLSVAGTDYCNPLALIQILVYDDNYKSVADCVTVSINDNGQVQLSR